MPEETAMTLDQAFTAAVAEQKPEKHAATAAEVSSETEPVQAGETQAEAQPTEEAAETEPLLTAEEDKLTGKEREKALNRAWTQKTMALAKQRKDMEAWQPFIKAFQDNPTEAAKSIVNQLGLKLAETSSEKPEDAMTAKLKTALGPDLEFLAEKLLPLFADVDGRLRQVQESHAQWTATAAKRDAEIALTSLSTRHPDWKKFEPKMLELSNKLEPRGMPEEEYLDLLYTLAAGRKATASETAKTIQKIVQAAEVESPIPGVGDHKVAPSPGKLPTFAEAFEAAKKGIRWE